MFYTCRWSKLCGVRVQKDVYTSREGCLIVPLPPVALDLPLTDDIHANNRSRTDTAVVASGNKRLATLTENQRAGI